jgi:hypothetical protein
MESFDRRHALAPSFLSLSNTDRTYLFTNDSITCYYMNTAITCRQIIDDSKCITNVMLIQFYQNVHVSYKVGE